MVAINVPSVPGVVLQLPLRVSQWLRRFVHHSALQTPAYLQLLGSLMGGLNGMSSYQQYFKMQVPSFGTTAFHPERWTDSR